MGKGESALVCKVSGYSSLWGTRLDSTIKLFLIKFKGQKTVAVQYEYRAIE